MDYYIGIDPGATGALALLDAGFNGALVWDYEERYTGISLIKNLLEEDCKFSAAIEKAQSMPAQGVVSMFKFGENYGYWRGILETLEIPFIYVTPHKWQKAVFNSMPKADTKTMSLDLARRLFPDVDLKYKKHHGRADALLIAYYLLKAA